jgi:alkylated DNA repair dioxygenase AlkB
VLFDFESEIPDIPGLTYTPGFVDAQTERRLVDAIDRGVWDTSWERRRQLYGLSACVMDFRRVKDGRREAMLLEPRSLLVLSDDARYEWEHGIARRKNDRWHGSLMPRSRRISVTFRRSKNTGV